MGEAMTKIDLPYIASNIAEWAHDGQTRRGGAAYYVHPQRVALACREMKLTETQIAAAWLHDAIEDGPPGVAMRIKMECGEEVLDLVLELTRPLGETYRGYIERQNEDTIPIKIADIVDNLTDDATPKKIRAYRDALVFFAAGEWPK